jgi:hypothetical protein
MTLAGMSGFKLSSSVRVKREPRNKHRRDADYLVGQTPKQATFHDIGLNVSHYDTLNVSHYDTMFAARQDSQNDELGIVRRKE